MERENTDKLSLVLTAPPPPHPSETGRELYCLKPRGWLSFCEKEFSLSLGINYKDWQVLGEMKDCGCVWAGHFPLYYLMPSPQDILVDLRQGTVAADICLTGFSILR